MIRRLRISPVVLLATSVLAPLHFAAAADLDNEIRNEAGITPVEYASGWYLRGDIGTFHGSGTVAYDVGGAQSFNNNPIFDNVSVGVGIGYVISESVRADFTIANTSGLSLSGASAYGGCGGIYTGECFHTTQAAVNFTDFALNGYWTLGSVAGLRPYIGSGIGLALVQWNDYDSQAYCALDPTETCAGAVHSGGVTREILPSGPQITEHGRSTAVSFSLMAGADYRLTDSLTLDVGYKFTRLIDAGLNGDTSDLANVDNLNVHQIRAGLRYEIW